MFFLIYHYNKEKQVGLRGQCGGISYNGSTDCVSGLTCFVVNTQYSMCEISCQAGFLCSTTTLTNSSIITITSIASVNNLTNYWPMSNLSDVVGGANLFGGGNYSFVSDRFGSPNSAIYFNKGYLQVPEGVYFSGDFTVTAWIFLKSYQSWSRIFEFGNGRDSDNVGLAMNATSSYLCGLVYIGSLRFSIQTSSVINLNKWYFISFVFNGTTGYVYVNGNQVAYGTLNLPNNITRTNNYIGKSNWPTDFNADAIYDEFKIYKVALSSNEISSEYQSSLNNGKENFLI
jgi:hypothetical protein